MVGLLGVAGMAQERTTSSWPRDVPRDYVITPIGYMHANCVRQVLEGQTVLADGRIQYPDGSVEASAPVCDYPRYSPQGALVAGNEPLTNGWVEFVYATTGSSYYKLTATWAVPPDPINYSNQTVYLFPGLQETNSDGTCILQPVLQYGPSPAGGGESWTAASYDCCVTKTSSYCSYSPLIGGSQGTVGTIKSYCEGQQECNTWLVQTQETGTAQKTGLVANTKGQVFDTAFAAALEVYGVTACDQYPDSTGDSFTAVELYDQKGNLIKDPGWTGQVNNVSPQCGFSVTTKPIRLGWKP